VIEKQTKLKIANVSGSVVKKACLPGRFSKFENGENRNSSLEKIRELSSFALHRIIGKNVLSKRKLKRIRTT
jgi:hypothetical protein